MAFLPLSGTSFTGVGVQFSRGVCNAVSRRSVTPERRRASFVSMAFSSIDMPETAVEVMDTSRDLDLVILAAYKHVFGNAYLMESERAELAKVESVFLQRQLSVRELVRGFAKSSAYRKRFFERSGPYRFVELNCKHFLGRGPCDQEEVSFHVQKLINEGYDAEIDSYLDSDEYEVKFGKWTVPRFVFEGAYGRNDYFNRMITMRKFWDGCSTSTVSGSTAPGKPIPPQLAMGRGDAVRNFAGIQKGLPAGFRPKGLDRKPLAPVPTNAQAPMKVRIKVVDNLYQVFEVPSLTLKDVEPQWKKELAGGRKLNGVWY